MCHGDGGRVGVRKKRRCLEKGVHTGTGPGMFVVDGPWGEEKQSASETGSLTLTRGVLRKLRQKQNDNTHPHPPTAVVCVRRQARERNWTMYLYLHRQKRNNTNLAT